MKVFDPNCSLCKGDGKVLRMVPHYLTGITQSWVEECDCDKFMEIQMGRKIEKIEASMKWVREQIERNEFCKDTCIPKAEGGDGGWEFHERELVRLTIILNLLGDLKTITQKENMPHMPGHTSYA